MNEKQRQAKEQNSQEPSVKPSDGDKTTQNHGNKAEIAANEEQSPEENPRLQVPQWLRDFGARLRAFTIPDWLMVLFTAGICYATFNYTEIANSTLSEMHSNAMAEQRAWVGPVEQNPPNGIHTEFEKGVAIAVVPYTNSGKTPALKTVAFIRWTTVADSINPAQFNGQSGKMAIFPGGVANISTRGTIPPIPASVEKSVAAGHLSVYVYGAIAYRDIFGRSHWTDFCFEQATNLQFYGPCPGTETTTDDEPTGTR